jgi:hypothetical protein
MTRVNQPKVQIIKSASDVVRSDMKDMENLQSRYNELETEHQEALNVIDELEFELSDVIILNFPVCQVKGFSVIVLCSFYVWPRLQIDYLEMETQRLQQENAKLREMLQQSDNP